MTQLSGNLEAFALSDVLSLLAMGGRTARVAVSSESADGEIRFSDGQVSGASADVTRAGLLRRVAFVAHVPVVDLAMALESDEPVRALVDSGVVNRELAQQVSVEQAVDAVGSMLGWGSGEFSVTLLGQDPADLGVRLSVREVVEAARTRAADWDRVRSELPEPGSVLSLTPTVDEPPTLTAEDWTVLARVDGRRSIDEILRYAGPVQLVASDRLLDLLRRGLIQVRPMGAGDDEQQLSGLVDGYEQSLPEVLRSAVESAEHAESGEAPPPAPPPPAPLTPSPMVDRIAAPPSSMAASPAPADQVAPVVEPGELAAVEVVAQRVEAEDLPAPGDAAIVAPAGSADEAQGMPVGTPALSPDPDEQIVEFADDPVSLLPSPAAGEPIDDRRTDEVERRAILTTLSEAAWSAAGQPSADMEAVDGPAPDTAADPRGAEEEPVLLAPAVEEEASFGSVGRTGSDLLSGPGILSTDADPHIEWAPEFARFAASMPEPFVPVVPRPAADEDDAEDPKAPAQLSEEGPVPFGARGW